MPAINVVLQPGTELASYRIESIIGRGGMGIVYLATQPRLGRRVALKVLAPELAEDAEFRERFMRESEVAASLEHPNVLPVYDAGEASGVLYLAMRYVDGQDLHAFLLQEVTLSPQRTVEVMSQVAGALDAAHRAGLVHRDVKPANILLAGDGHVYLSDFGIAKRIAATGLTRTGSFLGSVDYCAPEQIEDRPVDGKADVYALGCVAFHCLAGRPPFDKGTDVAVVNAHLLDPPPALSTVRPDLPSALDGVIVIAMAKHPEVRYGTAKELADALAQAVAEPTKAAPGAALGDASQAGVRADGRRRAGRDHADCRRPPSAPVALAARCRRALRPCGRERGHRRLGPDEGFGRESRRRHGGEHRSEGSTPVFAQRHSVPEPGREQATRRDGARSDRPAGSAILRRAPGRFG